MLFSALLLFIVLPAAMAQRAFINGVGVYIEARGTGNLHLLSYNNVFKEPPNVVGLMPSSGPRTTFLVVNSYGFLQFAFFWDGPQTAFARIGEFGGIRIPVGTGWENATHVTWNGTVLDTADVRGPVASAALRDNLVNAFVL